MAGKPGNAAAPSPRWGPSRPTRPREGRHPLPGGVAHGLLAVLGTAVPARAYPADNGWR